MTAFQKQEYGRKIMNRFTKKYIVARLLGVLLVAIPGSRMAVGVEIVEGEIGPGSVYGLFVPDGWNGDRALYAHGYVDTSSPIGLPPATQIEPLRDAMLDMGYAVAYSSFSENGWAVDDGVRRTRQLRGIFNSEFGSPNRTFLVAHSMGALVAAKLAEKTRITTTACLQCAASWTVFKPRLITPATSGSCSTCSIQAPCPGTCFTSPQGSISTTPS
jgi:hypothetical protein